MEVRVGLVGAGAWGRNLLRNLVACPDVELVAVCDPDGAARESALRCCPGLRYSADGHNRRTAAAQVEPRSLTVAALTEGAGARAKACGSEEKTVQADARGSGVRSCATLEELLDDRRIEALVIASPPRAHFAQALAAIETGRHVLVEKPMCMTPAEGLTLVERADAASLVLMVGHTFLYSNIVHEVKRRIDSGALGDIRCIYSQRLNLGRVRRDVDALWNFAPHDISITRFLLGDWPTRVNARGASFIQRDAGVADVAFFQMDFAAGQMMAGHVSWLDPQKVRRMVVVGSERMLVYDDVDTQHPIQIYDKSVEVEFQSATRDFSDFVTRTRAGDLVIPHITLVEPLGEEIAHFAHCVRTGAEPRTDGRDGLRVVCVLDALTRSMKAAGAPVDVEYAENPGGTGFQPVAAPVGNRCHTGGGEAAQAEACGSEEKTAQAEARSLTVAALTERAAAQAEACGSEEKTARAEARSLTVAALTERAAAVAAGGDR
jgi:predicted dehydrogenase